MIKLEKSTKFKGRKGPVVLMILDGWGIGDVLLLQHLLWIN